MKKLLFVVVLMLCLSFPVLGGHNLPGNWCECGEVGCICDPGEQGGNRSTGNVPDDSKPNDSKQDAPIGLGSETLLVLAVLLLVLRYKA